MAIGDGRHAGTNTFRGFAPGRVCYTPTINMSPEIPLVSIVVPAYNAERFLRASLDSIVSQTYPATEILLMDDASTDSTPAIARSYGDCIIYYRQLSNRGQFAN